MANHTCSAEGCEDPVGGPGSARGLCKRHYAQWWWKNRRPVSSDHRGIKRAKGTRLKVAEPRQCEQCGSTYEKPQNVTYGEWEKRRFCSAACQKRWLEAKPRKAVDLACVQCGAPFSVLPYRLAGPNPARFCSVACSAASRDTGYTAADKRIRRSPEYKAWRKAVFERDDYTCQQCAKRGGVLNADHIKPFAFYPELRFDVGNGRTLCEPCHRTTDTYGTKAWRH